MSQEKALNKFPDVETHKATHLHGSTLMPLTQAWASVEGGLQRAMASYVTNRVVRTSQARWGVGETGE